VTRATAALAFALLAASCQQADQSGTAKQATTKHPATTAAPTTAARPSTAAPVAKAPAPPARPDPAPLTIEAWVNSEPLTLSALKGKVVVLDFWAIYCGPCRTLIPHLNALYLKHKDQGLVVIGITEDRKPDVEKFAPKHQLTYPVGIDKLVDGNGVTLAAWKIVAIPTLCVIGRDGKLAWRGPGDKLTEDILTAELARK